MVQKFRDYLHSPEFQKSISQYGQDTLGQALFIASGPALVHA
jgi:hypothetical protein